MEQLGPRDNVWPLRGRCGWREKGSRGQGEGLEGGPAPGQTVEKRERMKWALSKGKVQPEGREWSCWASTRLSRGLQARAAVAQVGLP